jgi:phosphatidylglycerol lysyltransferase
MIIGNSIHRKLRSFVQFWKEMHHDRTAIGLWSVALLTGSMGFVNLWSSVFPGDPTRLEWLDFFMPIEIRAEAHIFSAMCGFLLLIMAVNLKRRKRMAWWITMGTCAVSIVTHLIKGLDYEECILAIVLMTQLLLMRKEFTARSDRPSIAQGIRHFGAALLFTLMYGSTGFYILDGHFSIHQGEKLIQHYNFDIKAAIIQTFELFFTADNTGLIPETVYATWFVHSIYAVGSLTILYAIGMLLRPVLLKNSAKADRKFAEVIINQYGQSSLARLALLSDKEYYFSPSHRSVIAFVVKGRSAIALGDPIGPEDDRLETLYSFRQFCRSNDWFPAFYEVGTEQLSCYRSMGWHWIQIGEEAIVDLSKFHLKGKSNQSLRTAVNRLTKTGHRFVVYEPPNSAELITKLKPVSDEWLKQKNGSEKQFSIAWFDRDYLQNYKIAVVYDANDRIVAFSNLLSGYNKKEVTIDLMRYRADVENGTMEYLFVSLLQHFKSEHYDTLSFSLSPLAGVGATTASPAIEKGLRRFVKYLNRFYNFNGLHQFKHKFQPDWEPRYLVFPNHQSLPEIALGLVRADSGDRLLDYLKGCN